MTDTATKPAPPRTILLAAIALGVSAMFGLLATVAERNSTFKTWDFNLYDQADLKSSLAKKSTPRHSRPYIQKSVEHAISFAPVIAIVGGLVLAFLAYSLLKGKYWARWSTIGLWLVGTLVGGVAGLPAVTIIGTDAPLPYRLLVFVGGVAMIAAIVLVNLRPSVAYLMLSRPVRAAPPARAGGGRGALFGPRPAANAPESPEPSARTGKASTQRVPSKPAATRAAAQRSRPKSKPRVDVTATWAEATPGKPAASRPRGKSRKN